MNKENNYLQKIIHYQNFNNYYKINKYTYKYKLLTGGLGVSFASSSKSKSKSNTDIDTDIDTKKYDTLPKEEDRNIINNNELNLILNKINEAFNACKKIFLNDSLFKNILDKINDSDDNKYLFSIRFNNINHKSLFIPIKLLNIKNIVNYLNISNISFLNLFYKFKYKNFIFKKILEFLCDYNTLNKRNEITGWDVLNEYIKEIEEQINYLNNNNSNSDELLIIKTHFFIYNKIKEKYSEINKIIEDNKTINKTINTQEYKNNLYKNINTQEYKDKIYKNIDDEFKDKIKNKDEIYNEIIQKFNNKSFKNGEYRKNISYKLKQEFKNLEISSINFYIYNDDKPKDFFKSITNSISKSYIYDVYKLTKKNNDFVLEKKITNIDDYNFTIKYDNYNKNIIKVNKNQISLDYFINISYLLLV